MFGVEGPYNIEMYKIEYKGKCNSPPTPISLLTAWYKFCKLFKL